MLHTVCSISQDSLSFLHIQIHQKRKRSAYLRYSNCCFKSTLLSDIICGPPAQYILVTGLCAEIDVVPSRALNPALTRDFVLESGRRQLGLIHPISVTENPCTLGSVRLVVLTEHVVHEAQYTPSHQTNTLYMTLSTPRFTSRTL
jgi:hypothetical protein